MMEWLTKYRINRLKIDKVRLESEMKWTQENKGLTFKADSIKLAVISEKLNQLSRG